MHCTEIGSWPICRLRLVGIDDVQFDDTSLSAVGQQQDTFCVGFTANNNANIIYAS